MDRGGRRAAWRAWLARVVAAAVGRDDDGLVRRGGGVGLNAGTDLDKSWSDLSLELASAVEAWRRNPLARRLVGLVSAYVVGEGITLTADDPALDAWVQAFWSHPENRLASRLHGWCDELTRSGELFVTLHTNVADGMSYVRLVPASTVDGVTWRAGDYECELSYHEAAGTDDPDYPAGRTWLSPAHPDADGQDEDGLIPPVMLHFAVNRPAGCVRGESDLAPVLPWLKRYSRWLEDRVRLNAAVRSFVWVARVPGRLVETRAAQYSAPPEAGSVLVVDKDHEEWQAVAPNLHGNDAEADGRAIRWMIAAGGPGIGLTDLGEAATSNLATAQAMGEQRLRFMRARQSAFASMLAQVALAAFNRAVRLGRAPGPERPAAAVRAIVPDISPADNAALARSAASIATAMEGLQRMGLEGEAFRALALKLVLRFAGEEG